MYNSRIGLKITNEYRNHTRNNKIWKRLQDSSKFYLY